MRLGSLFVACFVTVAMAPNAAVAKPPLVIVSAEATGEVVVIDPAKPQAVERIKVGARPRGLKLSRDGRTLFVAVAGAPVGSAKSAAPAEAGLAVVDVGARKVTKHVAMPPSPFGVDLLPNGRTAYVSNSATNEVFVIDVDKGSITKKTSTGAEPQGVAARPDGKVVYVVTHGADEISAIDTKSMGLLWRIGAGSRPQTVVFAPRGGIAFAIDEGLPSITIVDAKRNVFKEEFVIPGVAKAKPAPALQSGVLSPDGKLLYVTTGPGKSVLIIDPMKKALLGSIDGVGGFPRGIAISPDGKRLYTANGPSNDVAIIDVATKKVEARVAVPGAPWGIVLSR